MRKGQRLQRVKRIKRLPPGTAPGVINVPDDALKLCIRSFYYDAGSITEIELHTIQEIKSQLQNNPDKVHWFDIKGFSNRDFLEQLAELFGIHRLQMEDVVNVYQRPKVEEYKGHLFFISRVLYEVDNVIQNEQLSIFLGKNFVITLQDKYDDVLEPIRYRIRLGKGYMISSGADYLVYSLMDVVIDNYYPILEKLGDSLDELQEELITEPTRNSLNKVLQKKRAVKTGN